LEKANHVLFTKSVARETTLANILISNYMSLARSDVSVIQACSTGNNKKTCNMGGEGNTGIRYHLVGIH